MIQRIKNWGKKYKVIRIIYGKTRSILWDLHDICHNSFWTMEARLLNKPLIHVIGDSHIGTFKYSPRFIMHYISGATAHNLHKKISTSNSNKMLFDYIKNINTKKDIILLVFGEIDCRIHMYNQHKKYEIPIEDVITKTIVNYGKVMEQLKEMNLRFGIYGVPPATTQDNHYEYPYYASPEEHVKIFRKFNDTLKMYCMLNGFKYMDIYSKVVDEKGFPLEKYKKDDIHLNRKVVKFVEEWIKNVLE